VILNVNFTDEPFVPDEQRVRVAHLGERYHRLEVFFGFMDRPDLTGALHRCMDVGMPCDLENTTFFLGRETMIPKKKSDMAWWREKLFIAMSRNAERWRIILGCHTTGWWNWVPRSCCDQEETSEQTGEPTRGSRAG